MVTKYRWVSFFASKIIISTLFETLSIFVIILNSIFLALEDPTKDTQSDFLEFSASVFLYVYTLEMVLKVLGMGFVLNRGSYLRDTWNLLDFIIVISGYAPLLLGNASGINLSGLRSLRVLRPLKTVTAIRSLRSLVITIFAAIPYLLEIMVVLAFAFLIFAIAGLQLFTGLLQNSCIDLETGRLYLDPETSSTGYVMCTKSSCPTGP